MFFSLIQLNLYTYTSELPAYPSICSSVHPSVGPSRYFQTLKIDVFEGEKSSTDIVNDGTMSNDEEIASDVPCRTCYLQ